MHLTQPKNQYSSFSYQGSDLGIDFLLGMMITFFFEILPPAQLSPMPILYSFWSLISIAFLQCNKGGSLTHKFILLINKTKSVILSFLATSSQKHSRYYFLYLLNIRDISLVSSSLSSLFCFVHVSTTTHESYQLYCCSMLGITNTLPSTSDVLLFTICLLHDSSPKFQLFL